MKEEVSRDMTGEANGINHEFALCKLSTTCHVASLRQLPFLSSKMMRVKRAVENDSRDIPAAAGITLQLLESSEPFVCFSTHITNDDILVIWSTCEMNSTRVNQRTVTAGTLADITQKLSRPMLLETYE